MKARFPSQRSHGCEHRLRSGSTMLTKEKFPFGSVCLGAQGFMVEFIMKPIESGTLGIAEASKFQKPIRRVVCFY